jgi:hypothetical protein
MGAIAASKMPKAKTIRRKDNPGEVTMYAKGGKVKAKDECYSKVKSRYKVFPSAYASGAISKCRKVGAKNWGNKGGGS